MHSERSFFSRRPSGGRGRILFGVATSTRPAMPGSPQACDQTPCGHGAPPVHASAAGAYRGGAAWIFLLGKRRSERVKRLPAQSAVLEGPQWHQSQSTSYGYGSGYRHPCSTRLTSSVSAPIRSPRRIRSALSAPYPATLVVKRSPLREDRSRRGLELYVYHGIKSQGMIT